jgi:hypothetical protein
MEACTKILPRRPFLALRNVSLAIPNARYHPYAVLPLFPAPSLVYSIVGRMMSLLPQSAQITYYLCLVLVLHLKEFPQVPLNLSGARLDEFILQTKIIFCFFLSLL